MLKFILTLLAIISTSFAYVNGPCSGRSGICIDSGQCSYYGGSSYSGLCPYDINSVRCCDGIPCRANDGRTGTCVFSSQCSGESVSGKCPGGNDFKCCLGSSGGDSSSEGSTEVPTEGSYFGPCNGGGGACINIKAASCDTSTVSNLCPGGTNVKCCIAGGRPTWYINQNEHTTPVCTIGGEAKSLATSGCGMASLTMGISIATGVNLNPTDLFREAYQKGRYYGNGFDHEGISYMGSLHGVKVTWTDNTDLVYNALDSGNGVIFNVGPDSKYHFTTGGHYIFLKGAKTESGIKKVYVFDPNGRNNYVNVLFALKRSDGGIEMAKKGFYGDFGIVTKN